MLPYSAKTTESTRAPHRRVSDRHRKRGRNRMGTFAEAAAQYGVGKRGDGHCVIGRWINENLDKNDLAEFVRLANGHTWTLILRLSDGAIAQNSLTRHTHGVCQCPDGTAAKGCCGCEKSNA